MKKLFITLGITALLYVSATAQQSCGTVTDYDGNTYCTVQIGRQCWMAENLRTKSYADGTSIPKGSSESETTAYWCYPDGNSGNASQYGLLYNWKAVMRNASSSSSNPSGVQGICPKGWHVPSDAEWTQLENYVGSQPKYRCNDDMEKIAKALASTSGWKSGTDDPCTVGNGQSSNNATGFNAVPAGNYNGSYYVFGYNAYFWSATQYDSYYAYGRYLLYLNANVDRGYGSENYGYSVRCLRD